jgi:hypothetical protein
MVTSLVLFAMRRKL